MCVIQKHNSKQGFERKTIYFLIKVLDIFGSQSFTSYQNFLCTLHDLGDGGGAVILMLTLLLENLKEVLWNRFLLLALILKKVNTSSFRGMYFLKAVSILLCECMCMSNPMYHWENNKSHLLRYKLLWMQSGLLFPPINDAQGHFPRNSSHTSWVNLYRSNLQHVFTGIVCWWLSNFANFSIQQCPTTRIIRVP